jgi:hypothetical protein
MNNDDTFPSKWQKKLPDGFTDTVESMDQKEIQKIIFYCEGHIYTVDKAKQADAKLNGAKDLAKEYAAPYAESKAALTAKIKYCLYLLESRGVDLEKP